MVNYYTFMREKEMAAYLIYSELRVMRVYDSGREIIALRPCVVYSNDTGV